MLKLRKFNVHNEPYDAPEKSGLSPEEKAPQKAHWKRICKKYIIPSLCLCLMTAFLFGILIAVVSASMISVGQKKLVTIEKASALHSERSFDCIVVLGAGLRPDGSPSDMLHDRVAVGVELYNALGGIPILMSGDQTGDYNEVAAMKALAVSLGVPEKDIFLDAKGFSTYESIWRAKEIYDARRILLVTQEYHLYRGLYLSEALGVEALGISADLRTYRGQIKREVREILARYKDLFNGAKLKHPILDEPSVSLS